MKVSVTSARYVALEQRLNKISAHARSLVHVALHDREKGADVWAENSRTEAGLEFLEVMLDEMLIAVLGSDATVVDTVGDPYEDMPDVVRDEEIEELLATRDRTPHFNVVGMEYTGTVLDAIARIADALIEREDRFDTPVAHYANLIASLAAGQITTKVALEALTNA